MNYLSQAKTRSDNEAINKEMEAFEKNSQKKLPPIFRAFVQNYDLGFFSEAIFSRYFSPEYQDYYHFEKATFASNPEVILYDFLSPANYIQTQENIYHYEEDAVIIKEKICIAEIAGGMLLLGCGASNTDLIYADMLSSDHRPQLIAENIFEFLRNMVLSIDEDELQSKGIDASKLYQKWGEDFWRF